MGAALGCQGCDCGVALTQTSGFECCFNGCSREIWSVGQEGTLKVSMSSATCLSCRRVVFCLDHFMELYAGYARFSCVQCGAAEWWLCVFEGDHIEPLLESRLQAEGARIDYQSQTGAEPSILGWGVQYQTELPAGFRPFSGGLAIQQGESSTGVWAHGQIRRLSGTPVIASGDCSANGHRIVLACERSLNDHHLLCLDGNHPPVRLHGLEGQRLMAPAFVDERRFVYIRSDAEEATLWEGVYSDDGCVRSRRVAGIGRMPSGPPLLSVSRRNAAVTVRSLGGRCELVRVELDDGQLDVLCPLGAPPRRLACSAKTGTVAWIDWHGEVRYLQAESDSPKLIGGRA